MRYLNKIPLRYIVSVNGKKRGEVDVPTNSSKEEIIAEAKRSIPKWLEGKDIIKEIVVPNKLINLVIK